MAWEDESSGNFFKVSEGESAEFTVLKIHEKKAQEGGKIKNLAGKDYYYEFETDRGNMLVNSLGLMYALTSAGVRENMKIKLTYVKKGIPGRVSEYKVEILEEGVESQETPF